MSEQHTPIRAGIVGAGLMGYWHARTVQDLGGQVVAVVDRDERAAQRLAERFPRAKMHVGGDLLAPEMPAVDVWHICTPLETHAELATMALNAGRHVLVEKPLAPTAGETERLLALAAEREVLLCPVHQFPFQDGAQQVSRRLRELAPLVSFHYTTRSAGGEGHSAAEIAQIAAGILPHPLSLIGSLLKVELAAISWQVTKPQPAEWLLVGQGAGIGLAIAISMTGRPTVNRCEIVGAGGTAHLDLFHGYAIIEGGAVSRTRKISHPFRLSARHLWTAGANLGRRALQREPAYPGLRSLVRAFHAAVRRATPAPISAEETLAVAQACDRIQALAAN